MQLFRGRCISVAVILQGENLADRRSYEGPGIQAKGEATSTEIL